MMRPQRLPPKAKRVDDNPFWRSFNHAFEGIIYATRTQRNMRIHLVAALLVLMATMWLRLERAYVAIVVVLVALVLAMELMNTAIEAVVDLMTVAHHPLAKIAKDAAAGAVLVVSIAAVVVGYLVFYEGIIAEGNRVSEMVKAVPVSFAFVTITIVAIATILLKARLGTRGTPLQGGAVSGHASLAFAAATLIALLVGGVLVSTLAYFLALLVAQSRIEGGIHSRWEVLYGAVLGVSLTCGVYLLIRVG
jgi:diacylglycerol kinase (ATP)